MKITYRIRTDKIRNEDNKEFTVYGIEAVDTNDKVIRSIPDVFFSKLKAEKFVRACNREQLSPIHLTDVIEDALV